MNPLLFVDLETTGLDPKKCKIIEYAFILVYIDEGNAIIFKECEGVLKTEPSDWEGVHPAALEMHTKSGLKERSLATESELFQMEAAILKMLNEFNEEGLPGSGEPPYLAGSSVQFDRSFLKEHTDPEVYKLFHYRNMDVTSIATWANTLGVPTMEKKKTHTAMSDIRETMAELDYLEKALKELFS